MTHSFITRLSRNICLLALCLGQVLMTTPVMAATTAPKAAQDGASKGTQSTIKEGIDYAGRGLGDVQAGVNAGAGAANDVLGAAGAFGVDTGGIGGQIGSITGGLGQGQNILNQAGKLAGTDFNGLVPSLGNGKFDFANMKDAFGSQLSGIGKTLGNKWDSVKGISMSGIWGDTTNFMKDLTPDIKGLTAEKLMEFDFSGLTTLFPEGGIPSMLVDLEPVNIFTVVSTEATFASKEAQLAYEQAYTPTIGPVGVMDGRMGLCVVNGHDYSGIISAWVTGPGKEFEGYYPFLYLDTNCWITVGVGSVLKQYGDSKEAQKNYFLSMEYSPKEQQDAEFERAYAESTACRAECAKVGKDSLNRCKNMAQKGGKYYAGVYTGRISDTAVIDAASKELCDGHIRPYLTKYVTQSGGNYANLALMHQLGLMDMSYQRPKSVTNDPGAPQIRSGVIANNCSAAVSGFNSGKMPSLAGPERTAWRKSAICGGGGGK